MAGIDTFISELDTMGETLEAVHGKEYMTLAISFFSLTNFGETLIDAAKVSEEEKHMMGMVLATLSYQVMTGALTPLHKQRYPDKDENHLRNYIAGFVKDIESLNKKQRELNTQ